MSGKTVLITGGNTGVAGDAHAGCLYVCLCVCARTLRKEMMIVHRGDLVSSAFSCFLSKHSKLIWKGFRT